MAKFFQILDLGIAAMNKNIAVIGIATGVILAFINVVLRYFFDSGLTWAGEATNYLFVWSALFGAAYGFKKGIHIAVTLLIEQFPPLIAKGYLILANIISLVFLLFIAYFGLQYVFLVKEMNYMSIDLGIPQWIPILALPIAFLGASYRAGEKIYEISQQSADMVIKSAADEIIHDSVIKD
ncbi:MAG: TRAP transporter small permease [Wolinella sp.]